MIDINVNALQIYRPTSCTTLQDIRWNQVVIVVCINTYINYNTRIKLNTIQSETVAQGNTFRLIRNRVDNHL